MSFIFELSTGPVTEAQAKVLVTATENPRFWPVGTSQPRRGLLRRRTGPRHIYLPDKDGQHHMLSDDAMWDVPAWDMTAETCSKLSNTLTLIGQELDRPFSVRAYWVGDEVETERDVSLDELASIVLASGLNPNTLYRVQTP